MLSAAKGAAWDSFPLPSKLPLTLALCVKSMINHFSKLKNRPLLVSVFGWVLFPSMYLLVGILTAFGTSVETSFLITSPVGVLGFICWVAAFIISVSQLVKRESFVASIGGLFSSFIPLAFLGFGFWVATNGGV